MNFTPMDFPPSIPSRKTAPFVVEHQRLDQTPSGSFRPHARLILSPSLRTSGFWNALPAEEMKTLLLLLTFLNANGWCRPTLPQLAEAMQTSQGKARARLQRLEQTPWQGQPLARHMAQENGVEVWTPAPHLMDVQETAPVLAAAEPFLRPAGREALIAWSRAQYARPRQEVEQDIARRMGWGPPAFEGDDPAVAEGKRQTYGQLTTLGLSKEQALDALSRFDLSRIERQIEWLPLRQAKSPSRFLLAAIEDDYEPPPILRLRRDLAQAHTEHAPAEQALQTPDASGPPAREPGPSLPGSDISLPETSLAIPETGVETQDGQAPDYPSLDSETL